MPSLGLGDVVNPDLFAAAIRMATPLALAAIGGTICERSGVVNIALEGIMLVGAFFGVVATLALQSFLGPWAVWVGVIAAVAAGVVYASIHAYASINLRVDQVVSGTALNILALGLTGFLMTVIYGHPGTTDGIRFSLGPVFDFTVSPSGVLGQIWSWVDTILLSYTPIVYLCVLVAVIAHWAVYKTRWGLRLRALGEHPRAADTVGVRVLAGRWRAVLISGALGGLAGANLSLEQVGAFSENMTSGRGFIALAANIFGRWTPIGSYLASLLFGFAEALQLRLQVFTQQTHIPAEVFSMLPYILTVVVLAGAMGRAVGPAAIGKPYVKE